MRMVESRTSIVAPKATTLVSPTLVMLTSGRSKIDLPL